MAEPTHKKLRVVKLLEILQQDTDSEHPLGTNSLLQRLADIGFAADRRTVARDIEILNAQGYEVMHVKDGKQNANPPTKHAGIIALRALNPPKANIIINGISIIIGPS